MVEDVIMGCGMPEGETGMNVARNATLWAGLPVLFRVSLAVPPPARARACRVRERLSLPLSPPLSLAFSLSLSFSLSERKCVR